MKLKDLEAKLAKNYNGTLWENYNKYRIYFEHTSKVVTFIELEVIDNKVVESSAKCYYTGKPANSNKWVFNYTKKAREYIDDINKYVQTLLNSKA